MYYPWIFIMYNIIYLWAKAFWQNWTNGTTITWTIVTSSGITCRKSQDTVLGYSSFLDLWSSLSMFNYCDNWMKVMHTFVQFAKIVLSINIICFYKFKCVMWQVSCKYCYTVVCFIVLDGIRKMSIAQTDTDTTVSGRDMIVNDCLK